MKIIDFIFVLFCVLAGCTGFYVSIEMGVEGIVLGFIIGSIFVGFFRNEGKK